MKFRRFTAILLASALFLALCVTAASAGVIGYALHTNIVAKINGHPLRSYNIDGWTAVVAEDLRGYGFNVRWDPQARTLSVTRAVQYGDLVTPDPWPSYTPQPNKYRVGSRAETISSTNIVTYVAGERIDGKNIDGETLVMMDDLAPFGAVVWNEQTRVIELTLGDPVQIALQPMIDSLEAWKSSGPGTSYELYPTATGTLFVYRQTGTPHGVNEGMIFCRKDGTQLPIAGLLADNGYAGSSVWHILQPRDVQVNDAGTRLTFVTPLRKTAPDGYGENLGDTLCTVDLIAGKLLSAEPVGGGLTDWSISGVPVEGITFHDTLDLAVSRRGTDVIPIVTKYPGVGMQAEINGREVTVVTTARMLDGESAYSKAILALRALGLPNVVNGTENTRATEEQLAALREHFSVQLNGKDVAGNPCWSQGNNHVDLTFTFDSPLALRDGDLVTVTLG